MLNCYCEWHVSSYCPWPVSWLLSSRDGGTWVRAAHAHEAPWRPLQPGGGGHLQALTMGRGSSCKASHPCDTRARVLPYFMDEAADILKARRMASAELALECRSSDSEPGSLLPSAPSWSLWLVAEPSAPGPLARWSCRSLKHSARPVLELSSLWDTAPGARNFPRARCPLQGPQDVLPALTCLLAAMGV